MHLQAGAVEITNHSHSCKPDAGMITARTMANWLRTRAELAEPQRVDKPLIETLRQIDFRAANHNHLAAAHKDAMRSATG